MDRSDGSPTARAGQPACQTLPVKGLGLLGGALLLLLFVRLLHDPHLPPRLFWLSWVTALVVMARFAWLGGDWLVRTSPVALPEGAPPRAVAARLVLWHSFALGGLVSLFASLGMVAGLGSPEPGPPPHPSWLDLLGGRGSHPPSAGVEPGIYLGLALVFVPTALICGALTPWARRTLACHGWLTSEDRGASSSGLILTLAGVVLLYLLLHPPQDRLVVALWRLLCPTVLAQHALASAAAGGVWKIWFWVRPAGGDRPAGPGPSLDRP